MEHESTSLRGEYGRKILVASIVLEGLPADRSRDYRLNRNSLRGRFRQGPKHTRFASLSGIVAIWQEDAQLRGRIRALVKQQRFSVLLGWTGNRKTLLVGDFVARHDPQRTADLVSRSESGGMQRNSAPAGHGQPRAVTGPNPSTANPGK
ncbi:MAG: hypothetical protein GY842_17135 [bacterium]|nr:hypothetical protein [bacterium]